VDKNTRGFSRAAEEVAVAAAATLCRPSAEEEEAPTKQRLLLAVAEPLVERYRSIARQLRDRSCLTNSNPAQPPTGPVAIRKSSATPKVAVIL